MNKVERLPTVEELRGHVHLILCGHDGLDPGQTPLSEAVITRKGRPCGLYFVAQGPRRVRTYAIWAGEENRILFYDSANVRFGETRLSEAPDPRKLVA